ncbi:MAG: amidohydrolase [Acidobacteriota bacterium]|nr:amidohydrolase [Acidobacteriota bacterium]
MHFFRSIPFALLLLAACNVSTPPVETADLIISGAKLVTLDESMPNPEAMAVKDGKIMALGSLAEIEALKGPKTNLLRLDGQTVLPGFIEGHAHLLSMGEAQMKLKLGQAKTWDEIVNMVAEAVKQAQPGEWILGRGWHQEKFDPMPEVTVEGYPVHDKLSAVSPDNPVLLTHASGHALFANAKAMELGGVDDKTANPAGGKIVRDDKGRAIGVFEENAERLIRRAHGAYESKKTPEQHMAAKRKALDLAVQECLAKGITSFQDAGSSFSDIDLFKQAADEGKLNMRLWVMLGESNENLKAKAAEYKLTGYGNGHLTVGGIKRYIDGALGSRGAWLLEPYSDLANHVGQKVMPLETLAETANIALETGLQLCTHAIGDRGNREVLDVYEKVLAGQKKRWRIEHAQHLHPEDIPRFAKMDVIASMQGVHCTSDAPFVVKRLGEERARSGAYVWRGLLDSGAVVTNGTDAPVEDVDPLPSYYAMLTRKQDNGEAFFPEQSLKPLEALKCYTANNAYAAYEEDVKGTLSVGKYADFVVLSQDITDGDAEKIKSTKVLMTVVGGKTVYKNGDEG